MSVKDPNKFDGMGIDENTNTLVFLISDPYNWVIQEYEHLKGLQSKINNYVGYIQNKGYRAVYRNREFDHFRIEIAFQYQYTENCERFLNAGRRQLKELNIQLKYQVVNHKTEV